MNLVKVVQLEYYKFRQYRPFLIILGLYTACFLGSGIFVKRVLDYIMEKERDDELFHYLLGSGVPLFDFVDIWQNLGWLAAVFRWIPAFLVIISITVEFEQRTMKQNIIDGLTKAEYLGSKIALVTVISLGSALLLFLLGMFLGLLYSPVKGMHYILEHIEFVPAYGLEVFSFLCLAMLAAFVLRRSGVTIILFLIYTAFVEPIATAILHFNYKWEVWYFPVEAINLIIRVPFPKYWLDFVQDELVPRDIFMATGWSVVFLGITYWLMKRRDL